GDTEEAGETIGCETDHQIVEPAPVLVTREESRVAEVEPEPRAVDEYFGERCDVAKAKVEPLPRNRMDAVRCVADERDPVGHDLCAVVETERIGHPRRHQLHAAKQPASALFELGAEPPVPQLGKGGSFF